MKVELVGGPKCGEIYHIPDDYKSLDVGVIHKLRAEDFERGIASIPRAKAIYTWDGHEYFDDCKKFIYQGK